jgi:serine/threonine-protein kinase
VLRRELAELLAQPGADYTAPIHPPSEQRQGEPGEVEAPVIFEPTSKPRSRKLRVLAAGAAAAVLAAAVAFWSFPGTVPMPPADLYVAARPVAPSAPSASPKTVSPDMSAPAPTVPGGAGSSPAAVQEDGSTVKTQRPETPKQARTGRGQKAPPLPDVCKALPLAAALAMGCPGVQVRPEPFECPSGAEQAMREQLRWHSGERFLVIIDDRQDPSGQLWFSAGSDVVGVVPKSVDARQREVAPPGTRFLGGKVYLIPEKTSGGNPGRVVVKYDRVKLPGKDELPVCFVVEATAFEVKDTAGKAFNSTTGFPVDRWP